MNASILPPAWDITKGQNAFNEFMTKTMPQLNQYPVQTANPANTDRVAVTVFQPASALEKYGFQIRWNARMLGPAWAIQIFYGREEEREALSQMLGHPTSIIWTPITLFGQRNFQIDLKQYNLLRLSEDFWGNIKQEHLYIFEADSLLIQGSSCFDRFLHLDYIGAPWPSNFNVPWGGNGGFTLRRKSANLAAVRSGEMKMLIYHMHYNSWYRSEDINIVKQMRQMGFRLASVEEGQQFSVETQDYTSPCGFHKVWNYLGSKVTQRFLSQANAAMR